MVTIVLTQLQIGAASATNAVNSSGTTRVAQLTSTQNGETNSTQAKSHNEKFIIVQKGVEYLAENLTQESIDQMKSQIGVRDPNKNYNTLVDGMGTGLAPPTNEEWNSLIGQTIIDCVAQTNVGAPRAPSSVDLSQDIYFPPVRSQGTQGSCTAWAMTYYAYGYLEAKDNGWNAKSGNSQYLMSPAWTYNKVNGGTDGGSWTYRIGNIIEDWGTATLNTMPYNQADWTSWGNENAWREAPLHRAQTVFSIDYLGDPTVDTVKTLIAGGTPVTFSIDSDQFATAYVVDANWIISSTEYSSTTTNHAQTIVGYDGSVAENGEIGSFKVVNSWGASWGLSGFYWLTYGAFKEIGSQLDLRYLTDRSSYVPKLLATWGFSSGPTRDASIEVGLGSYASPVMQETPFYVGDNADPFPSFMALDITQFFPSYNPTCLSFYLSVGTSMTGGTISSFRIERYNPDYVVGYPSEVSPESGDVPRSTPGYVTTALPILNDTVSTHDIVVPKGGYYSFYWSLDSGNGVYGSYSVAGGQGCTFFICDSANFASYETNPDALPPVYYDYFNDVNSASWTFFVPSSDTWYFVFSNTYNHLWSKTVHLTFCQDLTGPASDCNWGPPNSNAAPNAVGSTVRLGMTSVDNEFSVLWNQVDIYNPNSVDVFSHRVYGSTFTTQWQIPLDAVTGTYTYTFSSSDACGNIGRYSVTDGVVALKYPTTNFATVSTNGYTYISWYESSALSGYRNHFEFSVSTGYANCYIMNQSNFSAFQSSQPFTAFASYYGYSGSAHNNWNAQATTAAGGNYYLVVQDESGQQLDVCYSNLNMTLMKHIDVSYLLNPAISSGKWVTYKIVDARNMAPSYTTGDAVKYSVLGKSVEGYGWYLGSISGFDTWAEGVKCNCYYNGILAETLWSNQTSFYPSLTYPSVFVPTTTMFFNNWVSQTSGETVTFGAMNTTLSWSGNYVGNLVLHLSMVYDVNTGTLLRYSVYASNSTYKVGFEEVIRGTNIPNVMPAISIVHPGSISFIVNSTGSAITWSTQGTYQRRYEIYQGNALIKNTSWSAGTVALPLDNLHLAVGTYTFTLKVYDYFEQSASDTVTVTVTAPPPPSQPAPDLTPILVGAGVLAVVAVAIAMVVIRKRKAVLQVKM